MMYWTIIHFVFNPKEIKSYVHREWTMIAMFIIENKIFFNDVIFYYFQNKKKLAWTIV